MTRTKYILIAFATFASGVASAQWTETGAWASASVYGKLTDGIDYSLSGAVRWENDVTRIGQSFLSAELGYDLPGNFSVSADYRQGFSRRSDMTWRGLQRGSVDLKWKQKLTKKVDVGMRLKAQSGYKGSLLDMAQTTFKTALRLRPTAYFDLPKGRSISTSVEFFMRQDAAAYFWTDTRYRVSFKDKVAKRKYLTISYLFEKERGGPDPWTYHVISVDFSLKRKKKTVDK